MIYYQDNLVTIIHGDCRDILSSIQGISAVVTDPPYELGFMGKKWDGTGIAFQTDTWRLIRKACLPGAPLLSFGGTRTSHRIACAIEDAGWQIRDTIMWVYGSGFPKSLDISKAIDKQKGIIRKGIIKRDGSATGSIVTTGSGNLKREYETGNPATPEAKLWEGYGTALKPAYEPIIVAMNPIDGTFADNALKWGVAGLNIDECRIKPPKDDKFGGGGLNSPHRGFMSNTKNTYQKGNGFRDDTSKGRFPANFIHDGSQEVMELFPDSKSTGGTGKISKSSPANTGGGYDYYNYSDSGSAARFFYCAKSSRGERDAGLEDMPLQEKWAGHANQITGSGTLAKPIMMRNTHPCVKPISLLTYLCKLVKMPEYNLILDPFCGSGSTLLACKKLGIPCIGIDSSEEYCEISAKRVYSFNG